MLTNGTITADSSWTTPSQNSIQSSTIPPEGVGVIVTDDYWYWSGLYDFYICLILIFCIAIIVVAISQKTRLEEQKRKARQRAQETYQANDTSYGCNSTPPSCPRSNTETIIQMTNSDSPPTYENAMSNYIDAKQQLQKMEVKMDNCLTLGASTTTIETDDGGDDVENKNQK